ncbi:MAG: extracellular solute-binding protein [Actinomycetota bacterium]|nr:extracellular solute-binding protein [Actinomycetota bacterium]
MLTGGRARVTALLGALAMVASACSGAADQGQGLNTQLHGQEIEVVAVWSGEEQASFEQVLRRFENRTGAKVRFTSTGRNIATELDRRLRASDAPDVAVLPQPGLLGELVSRRELEPVEAVAGTLVDENYAPVWRELGSVDGILYGVWFKAANKSTVWYRTKAFFDVGVAPPKTWQKLQDVSRRLDQKGITPLAVGAGDGWTLTDWFENVYLRTAGPARYDQLANRRIPWTDDSVREALRTLGQVLGRPEWLLGGAEGALATSFEGSVVQTFGQPAMAAMTFEGSFVAANIAKETRAEVGTDARFFEFPSINESEPSVIFGGDVAALLKDNEASRELIRFLATPEAAEPWAEAGGFISPNRSVDPAAYPDLTTRQLARALNHPGVVRFDLSDLVPASFGATDDQGMWKILQDWLENPADVDATAAQLEAAAAAAQP